MFEFVTTYSTKEAAKLLGFRSPSTLRDLAANHRIPGAFKHRQSWRIPCDYVEKCLKEEASRTEGKNAVGRKRGVTIKT